MMTEDFTRVCQIITMFNVKINQQLKSLDKFKTIIIAGPILYLTKRINSLLINSLWMGAGFMAY